MDRATELVRSWMGPGAIEGLTVEVVRLPGRTPVILAEVPATGDGADADTVCSTATSTSSRRWTGWRHGPGPVGAGARR